MPGQAWNAPLPQLCTSQDSSQCPLLSFTAQMLGDPNKNNIPESGLYLPRPEVRGCTVGSTLPPLVLPLLCG